MTGSRLLPLLFARVVKLRRECSLCCRSIMVTLEEVEVVVEKAVNAAAILELAGKVAGSSSPTKGNKNNIDGVGCNIACFRRIRP